MIRAVVGWSLRFRLLVVGIALMVMVVGIAQLRDAPADVLPEFTPPYVEVQTESLGLSAEEVEQFITVPLEADLLNGVEGVDVIRSQSVPGLSSIVLVFEPGFDLYRARALVQERLTQVSSSQAPALPRVAKPPVMLPPLSSSSRVLMIGLSSPELSGIEKSVIARWTVRPRLMGVPGVANVAIWGMRDRQLQVRVDPERLRDKNVTLSQLVRTTGNSQVASPVTFLEASTPGTGGFIETPQQRLQVRNVFDSIASAKGLGKIAVEGTGGALRLSDVANVVEDHQPLIGDAVVNDSKGLLLVVEKFPDANTLEVTNGVEEALAKLRPGLSELRTDTSVFRPATFIEDAIDNLTLALVIGGALLALVLVAFFLQWRTVVIGLVTIPLSMVVAALVLSLLGQTFNAISVAGLAVALAVVIDDAIVGTENVVRRLRQRRRSSDLSVASVVLEACTEVRAPLAYATLVALVAILPVAVMAGRPGAFFEPLALSYAIAVIAAMVVALTVTPALSLLLFSQGSFPQRESPLLLRLLRPRYDRALARLLSRPRTVLIAAATAVLVGLAVLPALGTSLIPSFKDRDVVVRLDGETGTSRARMVQIATRTSRELRSVHGVDNVGAHVGRAVTGDQVVDVSSGEVWVSLDRGADHDATVASIEDVASRVRGADSEVVTYSAQKIRDVGAVEQGDNPARGDGLDVLTGADKPLVVRVYGQSLDVLRREARRVRDVVSGVDGVVDPRPEMPAMQPTLEIEVDLDRALRYGIKPGDVRRSEATLLQGIQVGSVFEQQKVFEVMVQGAPETRRNPASVRNLLIDRPGGGHVRLGQVADVRVARTPAVIERDAVSRHIDVEAEVSGRSLDSAAGEVETRLAELNFPIEYHAQVLKEATGEEIGMHTVLAFAFAAAIAIFLLLQAGMGSWRLAALALLTMPVAVAGGVLGALLDGAEISLGSWIGFLALLGIAARAGMLLVGRFQDLERTGAEIFGPALVRRGAGDRLLPVLTSAAAVVAVMLPFAVMGGIPGLEIVHPMAVVILTGLVTSTLVSLIVLPALYLRFGDAGGPVPGLDTAARAPASATDPGPNGGETDAMRERSAGVEHGRRYVR